MAQISRRDILKGSAAVASAAALGHGALEPTRAAASEASRTYSYRGLVLGQAAQCVERGAGSHSVEALSRLLRGP